MESPKNILWFYFSTLHRNKKQLVIEMIQEIWPFYCRLGICNGVRIQYVSLN